MMARWLLPWERNANFGGALQQRQRAHADEIAGERVNRLAP